MSIIDSLKIKIEDKEKCQKLIKVEVASDKVAQTFEDVYKIIGREAQVPGFRKGKAPRDLLEANYADKAHEEVMRKIIWQAYYDIIDEKKIEPVSYPMFDDAEFKQDKSFSFTITIDIRPAINMKTYTGIKINQPSTDVDEAEVNKAVESLKDTFARFELVDSKPAVMGNYVICDYTCNVGEKAIDEQKSVWIMLEEKSKLSPLPESLIGVKKLEAKEVKMALPQDYKNKEYAGKEAVYKITVKEIREKILPEINEEFLKQVGNFASIEQLKDRIKEELMLRKKQHQRAAMENELFDSLVNANQFDVPESVVQRQLGSLVNDAKLRLMYQGYKKQDVEAQEEKLKESLAINAKKQVKIFFMLEQIAEKEKIEITDAEFEEGIDKMAKASHKTKEDFIKALEEQDMVDNTRAQLLHDKVIDYLLKNAKLTQAK